jgi:arylsulfatase A-like enzyme
MKKIFVVLTLCLLAGCVGNGLAASRPLRQAASAGPGQAQDRPNIIVFLADDLGYADVGVYGCKDIPTPHIDSIANKGARFTDGYANHPICSPSRAGLLSGMYQHRFGFENNSGPEDYAAANFGVPRDVPMLAERLNAAGYATCMVGKWHVGFNEGLRPHERGFDTFYGFLSGARSFYPVGPKQNNQLYRNGEPFNDETEYLTDAFARDSVRFIDRVRKHDGAEKPFFLFFSFNAVHLPLEATKEYESRFSRIKDPARKTYAGMLSALDDAIGRVMSRLRELGEEENTLVFFYSDNGGPTHETTSRNDPLRGFKGQMFEGGIRIPFAIQWPGKIRSGMTYRKPVMGFDAHATALAAAGVKLPPERPIDGKDLLPFLSGKNSSAPHDGLFWRAGAQHAARVGDWKLVKTRGLPAMLFNLAKDIGEQNDLAKREPEKLKELQSAYANWDGKMEKPRWIRQDRRNAEPGGKLKPRSAQSTGKRPSIKKAFTNADRNGDSKLSKAEFWKTEIFKAVDKDGDGYATIEEIRAHYAKQRGKGKK